MPSVGVSRHALARGDESACGLWPDQDHVTGARGVRPPRLQRFGRQRCPGSRVGPGSHARRFGFEENPQAVTDPIEVIWKLQALWEPSEAAGCVL